MVIHFIRHGESLANERNLFADGPRGRGRLG
jgi:broad specificity phosphatase PhoE